jgi:hypothetical protein
MEYRDQQGFLEAAEGWNVRVVVRRSNPESEPYIGKPGYVPKTNECKAETADLDVDKSGKRIRGRFNTQVNYRSTHFKAVMQFVNSRIRRDGKPVWMIQHGEGTYVMKGRLDGAGAEVFGPRAKPLAVNCHFDFDQWFKREFGYS